MNDQSPGFDRHQRALQLWAEYQMPIWLRGNGHLSPHGFRSIYNVDEVS